MAKYVKYLLLCLFISVLGRTGIFNFPRSVVQKMTTPLQYGLYRVAFNINSEYTFLANLQKLHTELGSLKKSNEDLILAKVKIKELEEENALFREQLKLSRLASRKLLPVRVLGFAYGSGGTSLLISKGEEDGVQKGSPLVYQEYFLGVVGAVYAKRSEVDLVTSPNVKILATTQEGNAHGIISQGLGLNVVMKNILLDETVGVGDIILTSGENENIPFGLVVGRVGSVSLSDKGVLKEASVEILLDPRRVETVFVITK